jgi:hypothetical protein
MPNINLTIQGKRAIGDGTKIVCMNKDYVVYITLNECPTLLDSPIKKLIVKGGLEYQEADMELVSQEDGTVMYSAVLPVVRRQKQVEIGVIGRIPGDENVEPHYSSTPAIFECSKSVVCDAVVLQRPTSLVERNIKENGTYRAIDFGGDGFYKVDVQVASKFEEGRTVNLEMASGDQVITPSAVQRTMEKVTITKPLNLTPANIKKDINIGGVVGTYAPETIEKEINAPGEYTAADDGVDGYSKVIVTEVEVTTEIREVTPSIAQQEITPQGAKYLEKVIVAPIPSKYCIPEGTKTITENGIHTVAGKSKVDVQVLGKPVYDGTVVIG